MVISFVSYQVLQKLTSVVEYSQREVIIVLKTRSAASGREPIGRLMKIFNIFIITIKINQNYGNRH